MIDPPTSEDPPMIHGAAQPDYIDRRVIEAIDTAKVYTDNTMKALKADLRQEWQADLQALENRVKVDTSAILTAVRERPQIPGWLAGLTPGRAAAIVGVLGGATSSLVALVAALVPLIAAMRGVYLPVAPVAAPTVQAAPNATEETP